MGQLVSPWYTHHMTTLTKIIVVLAVIGLGIVVATSTKHTAVAPTDSIKGCYVATLEKDRYTLAVTSENDGVIEGSLAFDNFEKDSSHGTFSGTYTNGILLGDYSFSSEGMDSVRQVIFKKVAGGFVEGFGDIKMEGDREVLVNPSGIIYNNTPVFVQTDDCSI